MRVGVIGAGKMGLYHLQKYQLLQSAKSNLELVGFFDPDLKRAAEVQRLTRVRPFATLPELLFEVDAVTIAAPTPTHFALVRQALEARVHVLVEKPMAERANQAEVLVELARREGLILQVGHVERFRMLQMLAGMDLSPVHFVETHRMHSTTGRESSVIDVVSDLMIHDLDLALALQPSFPSDITAIGTQVFTTQPDIANVRLEFPEGAVVNLNASRVSIEPQRKFRIFSPKGYATLDFISNQGQLFRLGSKGLVTQALAATHDCLELQCREFVENIEQGKRPTVSGEDGLKVMQVLELVKSRLQARSELLSRSAESQLQKPVSRTFSAQPGTH